jgi:hypothetical protein
LSWLQNNIIKHLSTLLRIGRMFHYRSLLGTHVICSMKMRIKIFGWFGIWKTFIGRSKFTVKVNIMNRRISKQRSEVPWVYSVSCEGSVTSVTFHNKFKSSVIRKYAVKRTEKTTDYTEINEYRLRYILKEYTRVHFKGL